jgi:phosphocarrier protein
MPEIHLQIKNKIGLHARPAALFVQTANQFASEIRLVASSGEAVNAKSILGILSLGLGQGAEVDLHAEGEDAELAIASLTAFWSDYLTDTES